METTSNKKFQRIVVMFALIVSGSVIYELPYLSYSYYDLMLEAFQITNTQMGILMSIYGIVAMFGYFPGGWAADRISPRKLLTFSLLTGGAAGFAFLTFPPYPILIAIYAFWGFSTSVTFWAALMKATRQLGDSNEQGRLFGALESGRGLLPILYGMVILAIFNFLGAELLGLKGVMLSYSILEIIGGIFVWFVIKEKNHSQDNTKVGAGLKDVVAVMKIPSVWLLAIIIFASYTLYTGLSYFTPYLTECYMATASQAAFFGLIKTYGFALVGGILAGIIADKIGSNSKVIVFSNILPIITLIALIFLPAQPGTIVAFLAITVVLGLSIFMVRGVYFAVIDEMQIPMQSCGAAIGFASFIGFMPESFVYTLYGSWLDAHPGITGYQYIFGYMLAISAIGFIIAIILYRRIKKAKLLGGNINVD